MFEELSDHVCTQGAIWFKDEINVQCHPLLLIICSNKIFFFKGNAFVKEPEKLRHFSLDS